MAKLVGGKKSTRGSAVVSMTLVSLSACLAGCVQEAENRGRIEAERAHQAQRLAQIETRQEMSDHGLRDRLAQVESLARATEIQQLRNEIQALGRDHRHEPATATGQADQRERPNTGTMNNLPIVRGSFVNSLDRPVDIAAILSKDGDERPFATVESGRRIDVKMYPGNQWRIRANGVVFAEYESGPNDGQVVDLKAISQSWLAQAEPRSPVTPTSDTTSAPVDSELATVAHTFDNSGRSQAAHIFAVLVDPQSGEELAVPYAVIEPGKKVDLFVLPTSRWRILSPGSPAEQPTTLAEYIPTRAAVRTVNLQRLIEAYAAQSDTPKLPMTIMGGADPADPGVLAPVPADNPPIAPTVLCKFVNDYAAEASPAEAKRLRDVDLFEVDVDPATGQRRATPRMHLKVGGEVSLYVPAGSRWQVRDGSRIVAEYQPGESLSTELRLGAMAEAWSGQPKDARFPVTTVPGAALAAATRDYVSVHALALNKAASTIRTFVNTTGREVKLVLLARGDDAASVAETEYAKLGHGQSVGVTAIAGLVWRVISGNEIIAEFEESADLGNTVGGHLDLNSLRRAWWSQAEPRPPMTTLKMIDFEQDSPEGRWIAAATVDDQTKLLYESFKVTKMQDGLTLDFELTTGDHWFFRRGPRASSAWFFVGATDANGATIFSNQDESTSFSVSKGEQAELIVDMGYRPNANDRTKQTIELVRDHRGDAGLALLNMTREDAAWNKWISHDQSPTWHRWSAEERASSGIADGFSGELLASQRSSYLGYNVALMDPDRLAEVSGTRDRLHPIFKITPDDSRDWSTYGTAYRIPWTFLLEPQVQGKSDEHMEVFTSSEQRQKSISASQSYGFAELSQSSENLDMEKKELACKRASKWASEYWLILHKAYAQLDPQFVQAVLNLPLTNGGIDDEAANVFFETYGTDYPVATLYGGRAYLEEYVSKTEIENEVSKGSSGKIEMQTTAGVGGNSAALKHGVANENKTRTTRGASVVLGSKPYWYSGGSGGTFETWDIGENKKLAPIMVMLRPINELMVPKLLQASSRIPVRSEDVQARASAISTARKAYTFRMGRAADKRKAGHTVSVNRSQVCEFTLNSIWLISSDDSNTPDPYGYVTLQAPKSMSPELSKVWERGRDKADDKDSTTKWKVNEILPGSNNPIATKKFYFAANVPISEREVELVVHLKDYYTGRPTSNDPLLGFTLKYPVGFYPQARMTSNPDRPGGLVTSINEKISKKEFGEMGWEVSWTLGFVAEPDNTSNLPKFLDLPNPSVKKNP